MAQFSNCLSIISRMSERDQGSLVARLDELQAQGVPAEKAQVQAAIDVLMRAQADEAGIQRSAARDVTETPEFKRWSGGAPLVRLGESHEYRSGQPVVVEALHGTTNSDLTAFKRERANIESDWGAGFYASNAPDDVATNYANNDGADLTQKIELLAERLASNEFDDDMDAAREEAKRRLTQESPNTMKLYVRMSNPAVQGGNGETFFDYSEEYDEETDSYAEPTGLLVDFVEALRDAASGFDESDADKAMGAVWDRVNDNDGIGLSDLVSALKSADGIAYATDGDGNIAASEIIRRALEGIGFDGVIDTTVSSKFDSMKGMDADTVHFIAFEPTQLKSATGNRGTFNPEDADITRSAARQIDTPEFRRWFADSKVVDAEGKPLVVYHGAASGFTEFKKKNIGARDPGFFGSGFYFAPDEDSAQGYADSASEADGGTKSGEVIDAYVSLKNPFIWDMEPGDGAKATRAALAKFGVDRSSVRGDSAALGSPDERKRFNSAVRSAGHDGVIVRDEDGIREVVAFEPEQIKSATGNNGAFDPNDADITRSVSRDTYAWRDSIDTSVGPLLQGEDFYLLPQREITQDDFGDNGFAANGLMGHAERAVPGTRTIAYRIVGDNGIIGTLVSDVDPAGVLRSVHDIEITDRRGGVGSKIVATIAANTQSPIKIQDITDEADPFWTRIGVGYKDQYGDAFLDWEDVAQYLGARRAAQVDPDAAASEGRSRGLQEGSYEVSELSPEEAADFFKFSKPRATETAAFKKWFGDSKVVDADGKPLVMYRGSQNENAAPYSDGGLIFLTTDKNFASNYATNGAVYPLYVKSSNPFDASRGRGIELWKRFEKETNAPSWALARSDRGALPYWTIEPELRRWLEKNDVEYDSIWFAESNGSSSLAVRNPTQIKSAVGNSGAFDPANPDITQSKGRTTGDYGREYTPQQLAMFKNTGRTVEKQSLVARVKEIRKDIWKKMAQGIVDQFRPIKDLGGDAYTLARLSKGSSGAFEALLNYGKLSIVDGAYDADMSGGFIKTVGEPLGAELEDWAWYVAANRAELLSAEDRENLFTPEDIAAGKSLATGQMDRDYVMLDGTVTRDRAKAYADSTKKFNAFNKNVLDIAEQSGLIDGESRQFWENEFYVPFYRVSDQDGEFMGAKIKGGLARQRAFQELKGGSQKLNSDLLANAMQNWAHLIDASAKNRAAKATLEAAERVGIAMESDQETVRQLGKSIGGKGGTVWFMDGGQQRHFLVGDPHLLVAINSLEYAGMRGPLMDALSTTKHWLTIGVTASPAFKVRNLIRDSLQAISVSDLSYNPLANLRDGIKASDRESQTYVSALASGGLIRFGTMLENNGAERVRRLVQKGVKPETILDSDDKLKAFYGKVIEPAVDAYNELGNRGEEINRAALFDQLKRQGMGQAEAALMARDLLDFSMQGTWTSIRFLTQVVPFLNARLQGLYVLGKGAAKNPQKFAITTGAVALAAISLLAAYHDDEDWKKREDWDRDTNFWFKIGGVAYRIPKPFEIGAIATLAERGVELFVNDEFTLKRFLERVKHIASDNLAMNPVPQAIKPMVDIYANKDSFSGRPIESMGMERLQSEYRYNANTSMVARAASTALNTVTRGTVGSDSLSPLQIDSLVRGYTGWLGTTIVASADALFRPLTNEPTRPQADYLKVVTQGIARQLPEPSSKYVSAVYDQAKILEQAYATHRQMIKEGKVEDAREFAKENREKLKRYKVVERVKQMQADINKRIREIERSEMSPEAKRYAIQKLREAQSRAAQLVY